MNRPRRPRRAAAYVLVLGCALLVALIGTSAVLAVRVQQRSSQGGQDFIRARYLAQTALELGLTTLNTDSDWRKNQPNGAWFTDRALELGFLSLKGVDPDGDLADSKADSLLLTGTGRSGDSRFCLQATLVPPVGPLTALATCVHAGGDVGVGFGVTFTVKNAPLSTNKKLVNYGTIKGNVEAKEVATLLPIQGTVTSSAPPKDLPDVETLNQYLALATPLPYTGNVSRLVLGPGYNSTGGATNPNGIYRLDSGGQGFTIQGSRVLGTLIIRTGGATVRIGQKVNFSPLRGAFPALIVDGDAEFLLGSSMRLSEIEWGTNFNPVGAPYQAVADLDNSDTYPNELNGLVHVTRRVFVTAETNINGVLLVGDQMSVTNTFTITHLPTLVSSPPRHYVAYGIPQISPGSWRQVLEP